MQSSPPKYPAAAAPALGHLKAAYNDIDIYVEDTSSYNMWMTILRNLLPPNRRLTSINVMGGRGGVINACKAHQAPGGRRRIFIVDGDFDFLEGRPKKRLRHLYRLRAYCVENLLIHEDAMLRVGRCASPNEPDDQIRLKFGFAAWLQGVVSALTPLFALYAVARTIDTSITTTGRAVNTLFIQTPQGPTLCPHKIKQRAIELLRKLRAKTNAAAIRLAMARVQPRISSLSSQQIISGKDYILPLFHLRMRRLLGYTGTADQLVASLAESFGQQQEPYFARTLRRVAR